jgi:hypothetical protein
VRVVQKHPASLQPRHAVPPLFALLVASGALLRLRGGRGRHLWLAIAGPWLTGALLFALRAARTGRAWSLLPALPAVFATLHLSYGFGVLWGLVRWAGRWTAAPPAAPPSGGRNPVADAASEVR